MQTVTIIGFGRFGKTLYRLIRDDFNVTIFSRRPEKITDKNLKVTNNIETAYKSDVIFYCVPISSFDSVIKSHKKYFRPGQVLIDTLSVKLYPEKFLSKYTKGLNVEIILTHPMFGPDSSKNGFDGLPMIMHNLKSSKNTFDFWKNYFKSKKLEVVEITPKEHDKLAANSQGLTHFIGRLLGEIKFDHTSIDSLGAKKLLEIKEQTVNDTWQLFHDLEIYNPYTVAMRDNLGRAYEKIYNKLLPTRVNPKFIIYGIQGGLGSFNEQAILNYVKKNKIEKYRIKYLYTTQKVLKNLHRGTIDFGLFAITNSTGGLVEESMNALMRYPCKIVEDFEILVQHFLMILKDAKMSDVDTIMAHPQALKQCEDTLTKKYSHLKLISGSGDFVDTARAAALLASGKLGKNIAILGPKTLADKFGFTIVAKDLQDKSDNYTRFLLVKR